MSLLHAAAPYRRDQRTSLRIPVVMPLVEVTVSEDGHLDVRLDREPYPHDRAVDRNDLKALLDGIAADLGTPVRVEVQEADGSSFTDIVRPPQAQPRQAEPSRDRRTSIGELAGEGFLPQEEVAVAVVVASKVARDDGTAQLRLPPALLEAHPRQVVLVGRNSGTVVLCGGTA